MKFLSYFNLRTFVALAISQLAAFLAIHFQIKFNLNLMLFGLVVVFPLHFTIQAAFKRREKALEYFSSFKGALMTLYYSINISGKLPPEKKVEGTNILKSISDLLAHQLETSEGGYEPIQRKMNEAYAFIQTNKEELSKRNVIKMLRYMGNATESSVYLASVARHRTMAGMRFYSLFFILIFPFFHAPILLHKLEHIAPDFAIYLIVGLASLFLILLNNFQHLIEYPFDQRGIDNIQLKEFKLDV
jgi:hypothetical protein